jgi:hypothetical protein
MPTRKTTRRKPSTAKRRPATKKAPARRARRNGATPTSPLYLRREHLNRDGYTSSGRYFGSGSPLYEYFDDSMGVHGYVRGSSRDAAKAAVRREVPGATFHR